MPHPSNPLDDYHTHSFTENYDLAFARYRGRLTFFFSPLYCSQSSERRVSEWSVCLMDQEGCGTRALLDSRYLSQIGWNILQRFDHNNDIVLLNMAITMSILGNL
jgi:hypothetical protein